MSINAQLALQLDVHRLTQPHTARRPSTYRNTGVLYRERVAGTVPGLIAQLRSIMGESVSSGGNSSGFEAKMPVNTAAFTLHEEIERTAREQYRKHTLGWQPFASVEANIEVWAALVRGRGDEEEMAEAAGIITGWVRAIETLFDPPRITELRDACPACGAEHATVTRDGERVRARALYAVQDRVACRACPATWKGEEIHGLRAALNAKKKPAQTAAESCHMA